jgi:hypothetical protein
MGQQNIFGEFPAPEAAYALKGEDSITASALKKASSAHIVSPFLICGRMSDRIRAPLLN